MRRFPAPSPSGRNTERLFLVKMPRHPLGALDSVNRHGDEDAPDLAALHIELSEMLAEVLSGEELERAISRLDECLGGAAREYDAGLDEEESEEERQREFRHHDDELPRHGISRDGQRMARDRRRQMASDAADERAEQSFNELFPGASRIKIGGC
jgi:hypothetical protein